MFPPKWGFSRLSSEFYGNYTYNVLLRKKKVRNDFLSFLRYRDVLLTCQICLRDQRQYANILHGLNKLVFDCLVFIFNE